MNRVCLIGLGLAVVLATAAARGAHSHSGTNFLSLAELQSAAISRGRLIQSFRVGGLVCALARERGLLVLQDQSASVLLEVPALNAAISIGNRLTIDGSDCTITRGRFAIQLATAPVVEIDGRHPPMTRRGSVFLDEGMAPLRVEWFNGISVGSLRLEFEGPGVSRQEIRDSSLWRQNPSRPEQFEPGLDYAAYVGTGWSLLPDFRRIQPLATGVVSNFDINRRARPEEAALLFTGFLEIGAAGIYTFQLTSDDGGRVRVGNPVEACVITILEQEPSAPVTKSLEQALSGRSQDQWVAVEGSVTLVSHNDDRLVLEVSERGMPFSVTILETGGLSATNLVRQRVRVKGVCQVARGPDQDLVARLVVLGPEGIEMLPLRDSNPGDLLTRAEQVRHLQPHEARKPFRAKLRGVVTMATPASLVLQDSSGGVFVHHAAEDWLNQPRAGELWEIEGTTDPGDFSPVIRSERAVCVGVAPLPEPIRPTWDQLLNGSQDAQQVELQGVVTAVTPAAMFLLTRDGKVRVNNHEYYPLPRLLFEGESLKGSRVRIRGVFTANWDLGTGRVKAGEFYIGNPFLTIEEPAPGDPFSAPPRRATDLLLFTSHAGPLERVKVAGQILYASAREYFLMDGTNGFRFHTQEPLPLQVGDLVEVVGFPRLGGASPILVEGQARKTGAASMPRPILVSVERLADRGHDSTLVQIEALLLSDSMGKEERVLELQAGPNHFLARSRAESNAGSPLRRGSRLQLTGVYASPRDDRAGNRLDAFELLLNRAGDVVVLQQGPWWTVRHTVLVVGVLITGLGLALVWITLLRRQVEQRGAQLAREIEQRQRVEQHHVMEQERIRVAQDLHDELGAGLTEMSILGSLANNPVIPPDKRKGYLEQLMQVSRSLVTGLDEIVWAVNPRYDSVADLASYYSLFAQRFLSLAGITCRLEIPGTLPEHPLDSRARHGIFLAFKEALNNVVRHAGATEVQLAIDVTGGELRISVVDNGRGFQTINDSPGMDGIAGMKKRMETLGGVCRLNSRPGAGTTVEFGLRLPGNHS